MITRTPKNKDVDLSSPESMFSAPVAEIFPEDENENQNQATDKNYDTLAKQLADLQTQMTETQKANMLLLTNPNWNQQNQDSFTPADPNKIALPDPALDPEGFDKATSERNRIRWANEEGQRKLQQRREQTIKDKTDNLWEAFGDKYEDMASDRERVDFVATSVVKSAIARGIDPEKYMFLTQDKFFEDVAKKYVEVFGEPEGDDADELEEDTRPSRRASPRTRTNTRSRNRSRSQDDDMVSRTGGIFGGNESGGRPNRRDRDDDENGPSMIDDIQAMQRKTGFF